MWSRLGYTLRETFASFRRNVTLTVAAIITVGGLAARVRPDPADASTASTTSSSQWEGGVEMIVFMQPERHRRPAARSSSRRSSDQAAVRSSTSSTATRRARSTRPDGCSPANPASRDLLDAEQHPDPVQGRARPTAPTSRLLRQLVETRSSELPSVYEVEFAEDQIDVDLASSRASSGCTLLILSILLLFAAVLLIWNTIRTAMFARRREIEVMKLVGATDWFIRIPFMLEGLLQGLIGGARRQRRAVADQQPLDQPASGLPARTAGFAALVVVDGYVQTGDA